MARCRDGTGAGIFHHHNGQEPLMKFDLIKPCRNCPFADTKTRITFACAERAAEIENQAYRRGFVCHEHSQCFEETEFEDGGFDFKLDGTSQHCFGAIAMYLKEGGSSVPWENAIEDDDSLEERWWARVSKAGLALIFENEHAFVAANGGIE